MNTNSILLRAIMAAFLMLTVSAADRPVATRPAAAEEEASASGRGATRGRRATSTATTVQPSLIEEGGTVGRDLGWFATAIKCKVDSGCCGRGDCCFPNLACGAAPVLTPTGPVVTVPAVGAPTICYNDDVCCGYKDCCDMVGMCGPAPTPTCYTDKWCCHFEDCCDMNNGMCGCYTDDACCGYGDCCPKADSKC
jgi:hypothetical protein